MMPKEALKKWWQRDILHEQNLKAWANQIAGGEDTTSKNPGNRWGYIGDMFLVMDQLLKEEKK